MFFIYTLSYYLTSASNNEIATKKQLCCFFSQWLCLLVEIATSFLTLTSQKLSQWQFFTFLQWHIFYNSFLSSFYYCLVFFTIIIYFIFLCFSFLLSIVFFLLFSRHHEKTIKLLVLLFSWWSSVAKDYYYN